MNHFQFSTIFSSRRKELGVTQEQIAQYAGVSRAAVSKWEKGQSYPDIMLLPKLATYFNISIDTLLGYKPQLTKERIIAMYAELAQQFATKPFEEVELQIEQLLQEYYACFPLLVKMSQLYLNYAPKAPEPLKIALRIQELCQRVREASGDYSLTMEATILEAHALLMQGKADEVLAQFGEDVQVQYGVDQLIARAHMMLGQNERAKAVMQVSLYQNLVFSVSTATELLMLEVGNTIYFDQAVRRIEHTLEVFNFKKINMNATLIFYVRALTGYAMQNRPEEAIQYLKKYANLCPTFKITSISRGDDYFYLLEKWLQSEMQLTSVMPRDEHSIKESMISTILDNPALAALQERADFKNIMMNLQHQLKI